MSSEGSKVSLTKAQRFNKTGKIKQAGYVNLRRLKANIHDIYDSRSRDTDPLNLSGPTPPPVPSTVPERSEEGSSAATADASQAVVDHLSEDRIDVVIPPDPRDPLCLEASDSKCLDALGMIKDKPKRKRNYPSHRSKKESLSHRLSLDTSSATAGGKVARAGSSEDGDRDPLLSPASSSGMSPKRRKPSGLLSPKASASSVASNLTSPQLPSSADVNASSTTASKTVGGAKEMEIQAGSVGTSKGDEKPELLSKQHPQRKPKADKYRYGNYSAYYGYRQPDPSADGRIRLLKAEWFEGKDVLDVGCNSGLVTQYIAAEFQPRSIIGLDIDGQLIGLARHNLLSFCKRGNYPRSFLWQYGAQSPPKFTGKFPTNVAYLTGNYVLDESVDMSLLRPQYDIVMMLSISKWIHLNWGDAGLKRAFKRAFAELRPGGTFILEPQSYGSYRRRVKLAPEMVANYEAIKMMPADFPTYLQSKEVGFESLKLLGMCDNKSKGFQRPLYAFTKPVDPGVVARMTDEDEVKALLSDLVLRVSMSRFY